MLTINIETSGAAYSENGENLEFYGRYELSNNLKRIGRDILNGMSNGTIMDINGNKVGEWRIK